MRASFFLPSNRLNADTLKLLLNNGKFLKESGVSVSPMPNSQDHGYLSGTPEKKAKILQSMLVDAPDLLFFTKGGFSAHAIIPWLGDVVVDKKNLFFGFSDHTSLLLHFYTKGARCFYGIDGLYGIRDHWEEIKRIQLGGVSNAAFLESLVTIKDGGFDGKLVGGFLESFLLYCLAFDFPLKGKVLFLESTCSIVDFEGYLWYMKSLGMLDQLGGIVFGNVFAGKDGRGIPEIVHDVFSDYEYKVCISDNLGHGKENALIEYGLDV